FTVEVGALVNLNKGEMPLLDGNAFDYKLLMYTSETGRNAAFFVDEDTFAVTVRYENTDKAVGLADLRVRGYVKLTAEDGSELVFYADPTMETADQSNLFAIYDVMSGCEAVQADLETLKRMKDVIEKCYTTQVVYVDAAADAGGDGSKTAPFRDFDTGFTKCKEIFASNGIPLRLTLLLADGEYGIYETQTLSGSDMPYKYNTFEITSANGKSTLTTTKNISADFEKYADNIWVAQLDKVADGSYPCFRYLYVDGKMADLSYNGTRYSTEDGVKYLSGYERTFDAPWGRVKELYDRYTLTVDSQSGYPDSRPDLDALFEKYKRSFLALREMESQFMAGTLAIDSQCSLFDDAAYVAEYEDFKLHRLALEDMRAQFKKLQGTQTQNYAEFLKFKPTQYTDNPSYVNKFNTLRNLIGKDAVMTLSTFGDHEPAVVSDARLESKYYLREELVGDLREAIAAGKKRNEARYEEIKKAYDAADAEGKAAMADELAAAELRVGKLTWFRYALEDAAPEMYQAGQWWHNIVHVNGVDYEDYVIDENGKKHVAVYMEPEEYANFFIHKTYAMTGRYVFMKNALAYVDSEGEYYYDEPDGKLYYYSATGVKDKSFAHASHDYMLVFNDVSGLTVTDLRFTGLDDAYLSHNDGCVSLGNVGGAPGAWDQGSELGYIFDRSAIVLNSGKNITISLCTFEELGTRGIFGRDLLSDIVIESNSFSRLGAGAIHLGGGGVQRTWLKGKSEFENIVINDNYISDVGREYYSSIALFVAFGKDLKITRNTVEKCPYTAIGVGLYYQPVSFDPQNSGSYHTYQAEIAYNYVSDFMQQIGDGGGIYVTGGNAKNTVVGHFNYIHDNYILFTNETGNGLGHMNVGVYFDGSASNWHCYS
ncbi:MAG: right-handed parallel beta-helix repeat-containing protein, partial [Clostridia bacterium]|nr:right-handed parallel beta-helix repeat-containing protein [Clostridia bacterium]